jgi:hypothetical protein
MAGNALPNAELFEMLDAFRKERLKRRLMGAAWNDPLGVVDPSMLAYTRANPFSRNVNWDGVEVLGKADQAASAAFDQFVLAMSMGLDLNSMQVRRAVPVSIFVQEVKPDAILRLQKAVSEFCEAVELELWRSYDAEFGSYVGRFVYGTKNPKNQAAVKAHFEKIDSLVRTAVEGKTQAEIEEIYANAAKASAEARKFDAEAEEKIANAAKTWAEAANKFVRALLTAAVGFNICLGLSQSKGTMTPKNYY